jgi:hypothetical protein
LGRAPVELLLDRDGDVVDKIPLLLLLVPLISFPFNVLMLFEAVSCLRKCLNENGFEISFGASLCLKSFVEQKNRQFILKEKYYFFPLLP